LTEESYSLTVTSDVANLGTVIDLVTQAAQKASLDEQDIRSVQMAVDEACINIMVHAYADAAGDIHLHCQVRPGECIITLCDHGRPFDPESVPSPDVTSDLKGRRVGGLGLYFMRKLMDEVRFSFDRDKGNQVVMIKRGRPSRQEGSG